MESEGMDHDKRLEEGLSDIHMEPPDKDDVAEHCKALVLDRHHFPWLVVSYQVGIAPYRGGMLGTKVEVEQGRVHREVQGCTQEGRQGLLGSLVVVVVVVEEDLKQKEVQMNTPRLGALYYTIPNAKVYTVYICVISYLDLATCLFKQESRTQNMKKIHKFIIIGNVKCYYCCSCKYYLTLFSINI